MKHNLFLSIAFLFLLLMSPQLVFAGAWTANKDSVYNKLAVNFFKANKNFTSSGGKEDMPGNGEFTDDNTVYYGEYGLDEGKTLFVSIPFKQMKYRSDTTNNEARMGVGDVDVGFRYRFAAQPAVFSVQGLVKLPWAYNKDDDLPLGNGQMDVEIRFLVGKSFHPLPMYAGVELGYRYRADAPSDEWKYLIEIGGNVTKNLYLRTKLDGTESVKNADKDTWQKQWETHNSNQMREKEIFALKEIANAPQIHFQHQSSGASGFATTLLAHALTR